VNTITHITMDDAHFFAGALIAHGWRNTDPDCVDRLYRQLVTITKLPPGYELAVSVATPEMEQAGRATGVNAAWSYAKCYRNMLDAQPRELAPCASAQGKPIGYMPAWAAAHMNDEVGGHRGWGVTTQIYREPMDGCAPIYLAPPEAARKAQILKGIGKMNGDGWKDSTRVGDVVFVWNTERPEPYTPGQFPRIASPGWSAGTEQYDFTPATADEARAAVEEIFAIRADEGEMPSAPSASSSDYEEVLAEHRRLVRELDVALNGQAGAAKQPSLCDIVRQVQREGIVMTPRITPNTLPDQRTALRQALNECAIRKD
jgi:hypothetical protein